MKISRKISIWIYIALVILVLIIFKIIVSNKNDAGWEDILKNNYEKESFMISHTLNDGRVIHFTFNVPYIVDNENSYVAESLSNSKLTIDDFMLGLDYVDIWMDGGSKIYKYNKNKKIYGNEEFYVVQCNSIDGIKDIYVAKYRESLNDKCSIKIDDLDGVSMSIKNDTLTRKGATIIITDTSNRKNIYGESYRIDKKDNGVWIELTPIIENYGFNDIGYYADENNELELNINWEWLYGELEICEYRIVKDISETGKGTNHYITTEFVIK